MVYFWSEFHSFSKGHEFKVKKNMHGTEKIYSQVSETGEYVVILDMFESISLFRSLPVMDRLQTTYPISSQITSKSS